MEATGNCKIGECALERSHWLRVAEGSLCKKAYVEWKKKKQPSEIIAII